MRLRAVFERLELPRLWDSHDGREYLDLLAVPA